jgi:hypothetical protein
LKNGGEKTRPTILGANTNTSLGLRCLDFIFWSFVKVTNFQMGATKQNKNGGSFAHAMWSQVSKHPVSPLWYETTFVKTFGIGCVWPPLEIILYLNHLVLMEIKDWSITR